MIVFDNFTQLKRWHNIKFVCTIGNFDGLHMAHQKLLRAVKHTAKRSHVRSLVITFRNHPQQVGKTKKKPILTSLQHKLVLLKHAGIDYCFVFSFHPALKNLSPEQFLHDVLFKRFPIAYIIVGYNFRFGKNRKGTPAVVDTYASHEGIRLTVQKPFTMGGMRISSSRIRKLISQGKLSKAGHLLGRRYSIFATVVRGLGRGTSLGFPTANLDVHSEVLPPCGGYIVKVNVWDIRFERTRRGTLIHDRILNKNLTGVCNLGYAPTFGDVRSPRAEVHIPGFTCNFKGKLLEVTFYDKIRKEKKFASPLELRKQIEKDIHKAILYFS